MLPAGLGSCLGILATVGLLAGCDEDSGSPSNGGTVTPTPTATATPSPTPTPTPTSGPGGASLTDLRVDQTFPTISAGLSVFRRTARLQVGPATTSAPTTGTLLSYTVSGQSLTFLLQNPTYPAGGASEYGVLFDPAQRSSDPALTNARTTTYGVTNSIYDRITLRQFNPGPGNDLLALYYASMGVFEIRHYFDSAFQQDVRPFAFFSQVTPAGALPQGSVTYEGVIDGFATPKDGLVTPNIGFAYTISGTIKITVNFATRTYTGTLTVNAVEDTNRTTIFSLGDMSLGQGNVSTASFSGALNEGSLLGSFAGPDGQEMGGTLLVTIPDPKQNNVPLALVSAFVAKR